MEAGRPVKRDPKRRYVEKQPITTGPFIWRAAAHGQGEGSGGALWQG